MTGSFYKSDMWHSIPGTEKSNLNVLSLEIILLYLIYKFEIYFVFSCESWTCLSFERNFPHGTTKTTHVSAVTLGLIHQENVIRNTNVRVIWKLQQTVYQTIPCFICNSSHCESYQILDYSSLIWGQLQPCLVFLSVKLCPRNYPPTSHLEKKNRKR